MIRWMGLVLLFLLTAFLLTGCGTVLLNQPVERKAKGWTITLTRYRDGPNGFAQADGTRLVSSDGQRFLWAYVTVRNDAATPRKFTYNRCDLDLGGDAILPSFVAWDFVLNQLADETEDYNAGGYRTRKLVYTYPEGRAPTRLRCADVEFPLPPTR